MSYMCTVAIRNNSKEKKKKKNYDCGGVDFQWENATEIKETSCKSVILLNWQFSARILKENGSFGGEKTNQASHRHPNHTAAGNKENISLVKSHI